LILRRARNSDFRELSVVRNDPCHCLGLSTPRLPIGSAGKTLFFENEAEGLFSSSTQSDGWQFFDSIGNGPIYVSGDAFVMRIGIPLENFLPNYKRQYNIPQEQEALR